VDLPLAVGQLGAVADRVVLVGGGLVEGIADLGETVRGVVGEAGAVAAGVGELGEVGDRVVLVGGLAAQRIGDPGQAVASGDKADVLGEALVGGADRRRDVWPGVTFVK
jgi:hypothetical protein